MKFLVHFGGGNLLSTLNFIWGVIGLKTFTNKVSFSKEVQITKVPVIVEFDLL